MGAVGACVLLALLISVVMISLHYILDVLIVLYCFYIR